MQMVAHLCAAVFFLCMDVGSILGRRSCGDNVKRRMVKNRLKELVVKRGACR